jgi:hypothetical protein
MELHLHICPDSAADHLINDQLPEPHARKAKAPVCCCLGKQNKPALKRAGSGRRKNDLIDNVDNPVGGCHICRKDGCAVHHDLAINYGELHGWASNGRYVARLDICSHDLAGDYVVGENLREHCPVGGQLGQRVGRDLGEGFIGRGKHRERSGTLQRLDQASIGKELGQRVE